MGNTNICIDSRYRGFNFFFLGRIWRSCDTEGGSGLEGKRLKMDAIKKQASKLREQVARQQQVPFIFLKNLLNLCSFYFLGFQVYFCVGGNELFSLNLAELSLFSGFFLVLGVEFYYLYLEFNCPLYLIFLMIILVFLCICIYSLVFFPSWLSLM